MGLGLLNVAALQPPEIAALPLQAGFLEYIGFAWLLFIFLPVIIAPIVRFLGLQGNVRSFYRQQKIRTINPRDSIARHQLGLIYLKWRDNRRALKFLKEAVDISPDHSEIQASYGIALLRAKRYEESITHSKIALELKPSQGYGETHLNIARCYRRLGDLVNAREWYEKALERNGSRAYPAYRLGVLARKRGEPEQARIYFRRAVEASNHPNPTARLSNFYWGWAARLASLGLL